MELVQKMLTGEIDEAVVDGKSRDCLKVVRTETLLNNASAKKCIDGDSIASQSNTNILITSNMSADWLKSGKDNGKRFLCTLINSCGATMLANLRFNRSVQKNTPMSSISFEFADYK